MLVDQSVKKLIGQLKDEDEVDAASLLNKFIESLQITSPYTQLIATRLGLNLDFFKRIEYSDFKSTDNQIQQMKFHHYAYKIIKWGLEILQAQKTVKLRKNIFDISGQDFHFVTQSKAHNIDFQEVEANYKQVYDPQSQRGLLSLYGSVSYNPNNNSHTPVKGQLQSYSDLTNHINRFLVKFEKKKRVLKNQIIQDIQTQKKQADYLVHQEEQKDKLREFFKIEHEKQLTTITTHLKQVEDKQLLYQVQKSEQTMNQLLKRTNINKRDLMKEQVVQNQLQQQTEKTQQKKIENNLKQQRSSDNRQFLKTALDGDLQKILENINEKNELTNVNREQANMRRTQILKKSSDKNNMVVEIAAIQDISKAQQKIQNLLGKMDSHVESIQQNYYKSFDDWNNKQLKVKMKKEKAKNFNISQQLAQDYQFSTSQSKQNDNIILKRLTKQNLLKSCSNMRRETNLQRQEDFFLTRERVTRLDELNNDRLLGIKQRKCDKWNDRKSYKNTLREKTIKGYQLQGQFEAELKNDLQQAAHQLFNEQTYNVNYQIQQDMENQKLQKPQDTGQQELTMIQKYANTKKNNAMKVLSSMLDDKEIENLLKFKKESRFISTSQ